MGADRFACGHHMWNVAAMLTLTLALLVDPAAAQDSPAATCANARSDDVAEVCLTEAAQNPDQVEAIAAALRAHIDRGTTADRALLDALLILMADETGIEGAARLATIADPRAVQPLIHAAENREIAVAVAAVNALAAYEEALIPLTRWIRQEPEGTAPERVAAANRKEVRLAAVDALGQIQSKEAADALIDTLRRPGIDADVRERMRGVVRDAYPDRIDELERQISVNGTPWLTAGGTWALGYSMTAAGYYGQTGSDLAPLGAITGGVAGATAGYLYGRAWPIEAGDAAFIASSGFMGTLSGLFIGSGLEVADPTGAAYLTGLGGEVVGYGLGAAFVNAHEGEARDTWEAMAVGSLGGVAVGSAAAYQRLRSSNRNPRQITPEIGVGVALGTIGGHLAAPHIQLSGWDGGMVVVSSAYGLAYGSLIPTGDGFRQGLPSLGLATGALTGYGLAASLEPEPDVLLGAVSGGAFGGFFGAGIAQMAVPRDQQIVDASALVGVTGGLAAGAYFSHVNPDPIDDRDIVLTAMTTSWAAGQTAGWAIYADANATAPGALYVIPSATGAAFAALSGTLDIPVTHSSAAASLGLWGAYVGGVSAELIREDPLLFSLVGSDVGLAAGAAVMSPLVGAPPLVIGLADAGGVLGGSTGALGAAIATDNSDTLLIASLIGSSVGLTAGAVVGTRWYKSGTSQNIAIAPPKLKMPGHYSVSPARIQGRDASVLGVRLGVDRW